MGDLEDLKESFEHLLYQQHSFTDGGFGGPERVVRASALSACRGRGSPPLIFQVTRFSCGGLAVGVSFNHILCNGRGAAQFLKGVGEIARGDVSFNHILCNGRGAAQFLKGVGEIARGEASKFSIEAVWQREVLKRHVTFYKEI